MFRVPRFWTVYATRLEWNCYISVGDPINWPSNFAPAGFRNVRSCYHCQKGWRQMNSATFSLVMKVSLCLSISTPWNGASLAKVYQKEWDSRSAQKYMLTVIWGGDGFHVVDLMTSQCIFNSEYFMSYVLASMVAKVFPGGEFHIFFDYNFTWITTEPTFQRPLSNLSLKTILDVCLTYLTILILHHQTSGFLVMWRLFRRPEQLLEAIAEFLNEIQPPEVRAVFSHWVERVRWVLKNNEDHYHE
jgi:hypothetical protein